MCLTKLLAGLLAFVFILNGPNRALAGDMPLVIQARVSSGILSATVRSRPSGTVMTRSRQVLLNTLGRSRTEGYHRVPKSIGPARGMETRLQGMGVLDPDKARFGRGTGINRAAAEGVKDLSRIDNQVSKPSILLLLGSGVLALMSMKQG